MIASDSDWLVETDVHLDRARAVFARDRVANAYALADLDPPFAAYVTVSVARRADQQPATACLVLRHPAFTAIATHGDPDGLAAILAAVELPQRTDIELPPHHRAVVERFYTLTRPRERLLMTVIGSTFRPPAERPAGLVRLGPADAACLSELYTRYPERSFVPAQLDTGVFYGIQEGGCLLAAGGTHVVAPAVGVGVVGGIFTLPEARGRGYGTATTAAVTADLLAHGCRDVCLSVDVDNDPAIRVYERLGFRTHARRWQGRAQRRA